MALWHVVHEDGPNPNPNPNPNPDPNPGPNPDPNPPSLALTPTPIPNQVHEDGDENDLEGCEVEEALARSRRRSERDRPEVARLVEDAAFLNHAGPGKGAAVHLKP